MEVEALEGKGKREMFVGEASKQMGGRCSLNAAQGQCR